MLLQFNNQVAFATGAASYVYRPVSDNDNSPRIILSISLAGRETLAFVDTGGINFLCSPLIASHLGLEPESRLGSMKLLFRGVLYFQSISANRHPTLPHFDTRHLDHARGQAIFATVVGAHG